MSQQLNLDDSGPDGLDLDRRDFLRTSALGAGVLGTGALGLDPFASPLGGDNILVVLQLSGGNDALNTLVPFDNDDYHRARPALRQRKQTCLEIAPGVGFHSAMKAINALFDDGDLAVLQGVGYPNPNRSHFKSMDIWHSADVSAGSRRRRTRRRFPSGSSFGGPSCWCHRSRRPS